MIDIEILYLSFVSIISKAIEKALGEIIGCLKVEYEVTDLVDYNKLHS